MNMLAAINEWRLEAGLYPLRMNETLTVLAQDQADFPGSQQALPEDVHRDPNGREFRERAFVPPYFWPVYGNNERLAAGEIAYVGASVQNAIDFWRGSRVHNNTVSNSSYREIGIGVVDHPFGNLWIVTFGARPGYFPALINPLDSTLHLSNEEYIYASGGGSIVSATNFEVISGIVNDAGGIVENAWQPWSQQIALPEVATSIFTIAYTDGSVFTFTPVDPQRDILWLPETVELALAGELFVSGSRSLDVDTEPAVTDASIETDRGILEIPFDPEVADMLASMNTWRLEQGLWPLRMNETLNVLAQDQADFLGGLDALPADVHRDPNGRDFRERAFVDPYDWPVYGTDDRVAAGEIAYVGASIDSAINFWKNSRIHNNTASNPAYREIGIGVVEHPYGRLWIITFGARPGYLPALIEPETRLLYLSNEQYLYAASGASIQIADRYQIVPGIVNDAGALDENAWLPWTPTVPFPSQDTGIFTVAYYDGTTVVFTPVDPLGDVAWLPDVLLAVRNNEVLAGENQAAASDDAAMTFDEMGSSSTTVDTIAGPGTSGLEPTAVPLDFNTTPPTATGIPPTQVPVVETAAGATNTLLITYTDRYLNVQNTSESALDLTGVVLTSADGANAIPMVNWDTQFATVPVQNFPAGVCVEVYSWSETDTLPALEECRERRSIITISPDNMFWRTGDFVVSENGIVVGTCFVDAGSCVIGLD